MSKLYTIKLTWTSGFSTSYTIHTDSHARLDYTESRIKLLAGIKEYTISTDNSVIRSGVIANSKTISPLFTTY